jgi:Tol biopolymer transport system component
VFLRDVLTSITSIVSGSTNGAPGNGQSHDAVMTSDARYIAFVSEANNLVANDTNRISDVFVRDMVSQTTVLASVGGSSRQFQYRAFGSASPLLSGDGRYVAFFSTASELLPGADSTESIWIRDLLTRATTCVSADARREANSVFGWTNASAFNHVLSADGRFVAYEATASPRSNDMPGLILRYDSLMGTTEVLATNANVASGALEDIQSLAMTPDGQFIAYVANGSAPASTNTCIEVWDARRGTTILASGDADGKVPVGSMCAALAIDLTGRYVSFMSTGLNLVTNALRGEYHLYRFDLQSNVTSLLDLDDQGAGLGVSPGSAPSLSADGELVAFESGPDASMELGRNRSSQVYLRDLRSNSMELISVRDAALPALAPRAQSTFGRPSLSGDGRFVAFSSDADNLVPGDTNRCTDVFVRDRLLARSGWCGGQRGFGGAVG